MEIHLATQIIKAVVNWNGQKVEFDKSFLKYNDLCELTVLDDGQTVTLTTKFK